MAPLHLSPNPVSFEQYSSPAKLLKEIPDCILCDSKGTMRYASCTDYYCGSPGEYSYLSCPSCDLLWVSPQPELSYLIELYNTYFGETLTVPELTRAPRSWTDFLRRAVLSTLGYPATRIERIMGIGLARVPLIREKARYGLGWTFLPYRQRGMFLEVGSGTGWFLKIMERWGWRGIGIEPDAKAVEIGRERYNVDIREGTIHELSFPQNTFDAIVMRHVIEHVPDPLSLLRQCSALLKPGGWLALATPNGRSLASRWFGRHWRGLMVPWHLFLFGPISMRLLLQKAGFTKVRVRTRAVSAHWIYTASRWIKEGRYHAHTQVPSNWLFHTLEVLLNFVQGGVGEEMEAVAQKPLDSTD
ncbi:MAG: class I SAM-dependent methyltransferase [Bacteroidia bacterium]|nr:class I SAM-dependent methyltransferase [Bacteroidia bacterium]